MPSSPNYKRNYKQEALTETDQRKQFRLERNSARKQLVQTGKVQRNSGMDVDHITPLSLGGDNSLANLRVKPASKNRSYPRNSDGSMKRTKKNGQI